jgi:hypothetical protein
MVCHADIAQRAFVQPAQRRNPATQDLMPAPLRSQGDGEFANARSRRTHDSQEVGKTGIDRIHLYRTFDNVGAAQRRANAVMSAAQRAGCSQCTE